MDKLGNLGSDKLDTQKSQERRLIEAIKSWTGERLIGDDCAILPGQMLVTCDTLVENTHFRLTDRNLTDLGWKSMAVNLSDIAAMAGRPRYAVVALTLPKAMSFHQIESFYSGLVDCAHSYRTRVVGGDLTAGERLSVSITVIGEVHECGVLKRDAARPGDIVVSTGDFGASAAGLWLSENGVAGYAHLRRAHNRPLPKLCESWALLRNADGRAAMMDSSDGLADALLQIGEQSGVDILVDEAKIAIHEETRAVAGLSGQSALDLALYGGEDYQLVATLSPASWEKLQQVFNGFCANPFVAIGSVSAAAATPSVTIKLTDDTKHKIKPGKIFQHWQ